ncbi:MAG: hypothetical protein RLZZ01_520 [Actinomycetota bacterium]
MLRGHGASAETASWPGIELSARSAVAASDSLAVRRDESGRVVLAVVADAVLFGRRSLAAELSCPADASTAELVLAGYERWGREVPDRLLGRFAFVVVDRRSGSSGDGVFLAVDHAGSRPLSFHVDDDRVVFSSIALALTGVPGVGHELDLDRLAQHVGLTFHGTRSVIRGVEHVAPGSSVWVSSAGVERTGWWRLEHIVAADRGSLDAHAEELRDVFDRAVADALDGYSRLGAQVSGGLDSTSVVATAARLRPDERIRTYTSVPPSGWVGPQRTGWDADERGLVEVLATRYPNLEPRWVESRRLSLLGRYEEMWELGAPPQRNTMNLIWIHAIGEEAAADGVDVLLSGAMGNRHFSADGPAWLVELARRARLRRLVSEARAWAVSTGRPVSSVLRSELLVPMVPRSIRRRRLTRRGVEGPIDSWLGATAISEQWRVDPGVRESVRAPDDAALSDWTRRVDDLFDMAPMAAQVRGVERAMWGFEMVDPTSDRRVVEVALTQPEWWRRHRGVDRAVVRRAMSDRLPSEIVDRRSRGEQLPDWFDRLVDVREEVTAEVEAAHDHPTSREVIDTARLRRLVQEWPGPGTPMTSEIGRAYRLALPRAVQMSKYARWFEQRARRVAAGGSSGVSPGV